MIASLRFDHPFWWYLAWNAVAFAAAIPYCSFAEWVTHKFFLHSDRIVKFAYALHALQHHVLFLGDESYETTPDHPNAQHVTFDPRDYVIILAANLPVFLLVEWLVGRPIVLGCMAMTFVGLQLFNSFHLRFHIPGDTWFQGTRFFRFLKDHHRIHHMRTDRNLNVFFLPLADLCLGTLVTRRSAALAGQRNAGCRETNER